jgi:hypothetical protein
MPTLADGSYSFAGLTPGTYTITETIPTGYADSSTTAGTINNNTVGSPSTQGFISNITLNAGDNGIQYDFSNGLPMS